LFARVRTVVLTSATLSTGGDLDFIKRRVGVDDARELLLASPFDYPDQAALYLAPGLPDPRDPGYLQLAAREIEALIRITGGGACVLSTSYRVVHALAQALRPARFPRTLVVQGEAPAAALLTRFRA